MGRADALLRKGAAAGRVVMLVVMFFGVWGCAQPQRTLVVTVGGLGFSQMHDLRKAVERECPEAKVVSAGMWDAYKADILKIAKEEKREHLILIGHSFGCEAIDKAADELPRVDLAVFIDPAWSDFALSRGITKYLWFKRSEGGVVREARIWGANGAQKIDGGHNEIPHSPELIERVVAEVRRISREEPKKRAGEEIVSAGGKGR